ncbi:response regulator [soil metagenome]|nr:response regulator [Gemmatimonadota bacterium]
MTASTVLLVEDNEDHWTIYRVLLEYVGYQVLLAGEGYEALRKAREEKPHIILMDISIPGIDGWEVTRILKADPDTASIPIVALTAHASEAARKRCEEVGCDGYLAKPVEPRRVLAEVERFIGMPTAGGG